MFINLNYVDNIKTKLQKLNLKDSNQSIKLFRSILIVVKNKINKLNSKFKINKKN